MNKTNSFPKRRLIPGERLIDPPQRNQSELLSSLSPYIRQSGDDWRRPWVLKERKLLDYLLVYIAQGKGLFSVNGNPFEVNDGDLIWIPPDTLHEMQGTSETMHCLFIHFDLLYDPARSHWDACIPGGTKDLEEFSNLMHPKIKHPVISRWKGKIHITNQAAILSILQKINIEYRRLQNGAALMLSGLILQLIDTIINGLAPLTGVSGNHWREMQEAAGYIQDHAENELNITRLAAHFHFSPSHFRKLFREIHGQSPRTMHRQARIRRACEMLVYSSLNISEIADRLKFSTPHNFSRAFSNVTSISPGNYRRGQG